MKGFIGLVVAQAARPSWRPTCRTRCTTPSATTRKWAASACQHLHRRPARCRHRGLPRCASSASRRAWCRPSRTRAWPLALLREGPRCAFVADADRGQRHRGRRAPGGPHGRHGRRLRSRGPAMRASTCRGPRRGGRDERRHRRQRGARGLPLPLRVPRPARARRGCAAAPRAQGHAAALEPAMHAVDAATGIRFETICAVPPFQARPTTPRCGWRSGWPAPTAPRWSASAPRPACSRAPASPPWSAGRARSPRRTRPTSTSAWSSWRAARPGRPAAQGRLTQRTAIAARSQSSARGSSPSARASWASRRQASRRASPARAGATAARSSGARALPQRPRSA
jgi:hypothetical protein